MADLSTRFGALPPRCRRSLWIHGADAIDFQIAGDLIASLIAPRPHVRLLLTATDSDTRDYLRSRYLDDLVLPVPPSRRLRNWLARLQVQHVVWLDGARTLPDDWPCQLPALGIAQSAVAIRQTCDLSTGLLAVARRPDAAIRLGVIDSEALDRLAVGGVPRSCLAITGSLHDQPPAGPHASAIRAALGLTPDVPLVAGCEPGGAATTPWPDWFTMVRRNAPGARLLLLAPDGPGASTALACWQATGLTVVRLDLAHPAPTGPWDVAIATNLGLGTTLLAGADQLIIARGDWPAAADRIADLGRAQGIPIMDCDGAGAALNHPDGLMPGVRQAPAGPRAVSPEVTDGRSTAGGRTAEALAPWIPTGPDLPPVAQDWRLPTWRDRIGSSRLWRSIGPRLPRQRFESWAELRSELGHPRTVLCLGNGPSSEDPQLAGLPQDCLIRVNWRWRDRGILTRPRIVFVGDARTIGAVDGAIYGFWNRALEDGMRLRHLLARGPGRMRYFTMERICPLIGDRVWPARPTNGALMVAAAVALAPERLVLAGLDLYDDASGRYPGDLLAANSYARAHTRSTDLAIIREALAGYRGELVVLGEPLRQALEHGSQVVP